MAGKKKQVEEQDGSWVAEVEKYSRQIWLAGLGAYAKAGKEGVKLFDALIKDGEAAEKTAKTELDKQIKVLKGKKSPLDNAKGKADKALGKLSGRWAELEEAFDKRMNSAVSRLGVPSRDEVQQLSARVDELAGLIAGLKKAAAKPKVAPKAVPAAAKLAAPAAPAASKPAAKSAAAP
ncbi:MAG: phasin family protein, partial [Halopseudomonas yangmingensis]